MTRQDRIEREVLVPAEIERVWRALTSPEELAQWFGDGAELDLRVGGAAKFSWSEYGESWEAVVQVVDPPNRFAYRWAVTSDTRVEDSPSTVVEFTLSTVDGGTMVRVVETGFASLPDEIYKRSLDENTSGWKAEVEDLVNYLSGDRAG